MHVETRELKVKGTCSIQVSYDFETNQVRVSSGSIGFPKKPPLVLGEERTWDFVQTEVLFVAKGYLAKNLETNELEVVAGPYEGGRRVLDTTGYQFLWTIFRCCSPPIHEAPATLMLFQLTGSSEGGAKCLNRL